MVPLQCDSGFLLLRGNFVWALRRVFGTRITHGGSQSIYVQALFNS